MSCISAVFLEFLITSSPASGTVPCSVVTRTSQLLQQRSAVRSQTPSRSALVLHRPQQSHVYPAGVSIGERFPMWDRALRAWLPWQHGRRERWRWTLVHCSLLLQGTAEQQPIAGCEPLWQFGCSHCLPCTGALFLFGRCSEGEGLLESM